MTKIGILVRLESWFCHSGFVKACLVRGVLVAHGEETFACSPFMGSCSFVFAKMDFIA